jgi:hypothetical protein
MGTNTEEIRDNPVPVPHLVPQISLDIPMVPTDCIQIFFLRVGNNAKFGVK